MAEELNIRTPARLAEIGWFVDLCNGDTEYLGVLDNDRRSNFANCAKVIHKADQAGFNTILLPSAYDVGQDPLLFAAATAGTTERIYPIVALRMGELHPPMLARSIAGLDHLLKGRLIINIISSDLPGYSTDADYRYRRAGEVISILKQGWNETTIDHGGENYTFKLPADPVKPYQQNGGPLLYFGGISDPAKDLAAKEVDVFLMWPETEQMMANTMLEMAQRAAGYGRVIDFGLRIHVIVRETEEAAKAHARKLISKLDESYGLALRSRGQDSRSYGVFRQDELRKTADEEGYIEPLVWSGIGKAWSGCGSAIVGSAEQVISKINRYMDMGFRAFIFSGFPLLEECEYFSKLVLPYLPQASLPKLQGKVNDTEPVTPLTTAVLK
ncbi:MAG: LLM class flavin-dependent oxidoreductase [Chitinophagales bacterium]|nr:LLM class flavin-dependent oxidoreductase [Chitinophagales bacterium]